MSWKDYKTREDRRPQEPLFSFFWGDALIILAFAGVATLLAFHIINYGN